MCHDCFGYWKVVQRINFDKSFYGNSELIFFMFKLVTKINLKIIFNIECDIMCFSETKYSSFLKWHSVELSYLYILLSTLLKWHFTEMMDVSIQKKLKLLFLSK